MFIVVCPGQGAQKPGFLSPWVEVPEHRATLERLSEVAGVDLVLHGTESDAETIRDTSIAQPLIVAAGIVAWNALRSVGVDTTFGGAAGHSVGEITACYVSGVLSAESAMQFVAKRSTLMARDAAQVSTGMAAVVGGKETDVLEALEACGCTPANMNCPGQIVAAGSEDSLAELAANPPRGTRVIPLQVAGAFHSPFMANAREALHAEANGVDAHDPLLTLWTNADGSTVHEGTDMVSRMVEQVTRPVRWDRCMESFTEAGVQGIVELCPAGTLVGLAKRGLKGTPTLALNTPEEVPSALSFCSAEGAVE